MKLKDIMSEKVEAISAQSNLVEAANRMARLDIGFLPVVGDSIVGVVTDRDIVVRAIAKGLDAGETKVGDVMTSAAEILSEDQDVEEAARLMQDKQVRRVLIKNDSDALVGVVSLGDLASEGHELKLTGRAMEKVCAG